MTNMQKFAEHIIAIANENDEYITNLKLHKIMYFAMKNTSTDLHFLINLYDEPFRVWRYGPTVRSVYDKYKEFVTTPIRFNEAKTYTEYDIFNKEIIKLLDEDVWDLVDICTNEDFYKENKKHIISSTSDIIYPLQQIIKSTIKRIPFLDEGFKFGHIPNIEGDGVYKTTEIKQLGFDEKKKQKMCKYCDRINVPFIDDMPKVPLKIFGNILENEKFGIQIFDYKTSQPMMLVSQKGFFDGEGVGTIYIPIDYCPYCGRKLGENKKEGKF